MVTKVQNAIVCSNWILIYLEGSFCVNIVIKEQNIDKCFIKDSVKFIQNLKEEFE